MAYTKELKTECDAPGCHKGAVVEVFNSKNASVGRFCKQDGHRALIRLMKMENREDKGY